MDLTIPSGDTLLLANAQYELRIRFADDSVITFLSGSVFIESEVAAWQ